MQALAPVLGLEPAVRLVVGAIPPLQVAGLLLLSRAVHGRATPHAVAATPLAYAYPYQFGFVNFSLGVAGALLLLAL